MWPGFFVLCCSLHFIVLIIFFEVFTLNCKVLFINFVYQSTFRIINNKQSEYENLKN